MVVNEQAEDAILRTIDRFRPRGAFARDASTAHHDYLAPRFQANRLQGRTTLDDEIFSIDNGLRYRPRSSAGRKAG